jgi:formyltetrahydrofolate synthetase
MNDAVVDTAFSEAREKFLQVGALTIKTTGSRQLATDLFDAVRAFRKQAEAQKEEVARPLKQAWEDAKKPFDDFVKECKGHESALQRKMGDYDAEQDRLARIEQAKIQAKIDADNAKKIAKAEEKGKDVTEVVLKVAPVVQAAPKTVTTQAGSTQTRIEKTVYGIKGAAENEDLTAVDPRIADLLKSYPALFRMDWVAFRKLASTGMLDQCGNVEKRTEYVYQQRGGK